ncbi:MAG: aldose epimerase family protein [Pseudochelatococcus sp.]|jgi:aldose 1-epimerase|uniref:aldose epimerase family protein n=1 Tax=Pseudochelatococcus sp. TaxID=2020869 RepID=UPI003D92B14B
MTISRFGEIDGESVDEIDIRAPQSGIEAKVMTWGAVVRDLRVRLGHGRYQRVVLGLNTIEDYVSHSPHMGAIVGRVANRIANGRFTLDGRTWTLTRNQSGRHTLHGGRGFGNRLWRLAAHDESSVTLTLVSPDGEDGFPGTVRVACTYRLLDPGVLRLELEAATDRPTPVNLAHHPYFNLDGEPTIFNHRLSIEADFFTPTDADLIPTGAIVPVSGTPNDFRAHRTIRFPDAKTGAPVHYDINFVLRRDRLDSPPSESPQDNAPPLARAALLSSYINNVSLEVWTTERGLQVYDGGKLDVPVPGLDGVRYGPGAGISLEAQNFPDAINQPAFPDPVLRPGGLYRQITEYRFSRQ